MPQRRGLTLTAAGVLALAALHLAASPVHAGVSCTPTVSGGLSCQVTTPAAPPKVSPVQAPPEYSAPRVPSGGVARPVSIGPVAAAPAPVSLLTATGQTVTPAQPCEGAPLASLTVPCTLATPQPAAAAAPVAAAAPAPVVTPAQVAQMALSSIALPSPTPGRSPADTLPDGRPTTWVKLPTWFYVPAAQWQPVSTTASLGGVTATATATPVTLTFDPGNGDAPVSCTGPGRAWVQGQDGNLDPAPNGCGHTYVKTSFGYPGGMVTARYSITWRVSWTGTGGAGGTFPDMTTSSTATFAVAEAQAVVQ